jgi:hypothetical protein
MNIFFLDNDPKLCAQYHCNKHCVKMLLELAQMLSFSHRILDGVKEIKKVNNRTKTIYRLPNHDDVIYKATHINHPCAVWVRESIDNYQLTYDIFRYLCEEYTYRYGKIHKSERLLFNILSNSPTNIPELGLTKKPQAMPDKYKCDDTIQAYRITTSARKPNLLCGQNDQFLNGLYYKYRRTI